MGRKMIVGLAMVLSFASFAVMASAPYLNVEQRLTAGQRHATGLDTLSPAQLELLNNLLREQSVKAAEADADSAAHGDDGKSHAWSIGMDSDPIKSRLKGSVSEWGPGTVFELENGQRWKVLKGHVKLPKTLQAPDVVVIPGISGRWFLQVDEDMPSPRVYRID